MVLALLPTAFAAEDGKVSTVTVETLVEPVYDEVGSFGGLSADKNDERAYAPVKEEDKWGYIDQTGKMVIEPRYDCAGTFNEGVAIALKTETIPSGYGDWTGNRFYLVKADGGEIPLSFTEFGTEYPLTLYSLSEYESRWGYYDGVVFVYGHSYRPDGTEILPKDVSALGPNLNMYNTVGPCVDGVIPVTAASEVEEGNSQAFFMDINGNITRVFPRAS